MNIGIYIYDQAEVLDFSGPFEVFSTAARLCSDSTPPFTTFLISEIGATVVARAGYRVVPDYDFHNHPPIDVLIVVGGVHHTEMNKPQVIDWISQQAQRASLVASVCTGAFLLAQAQVVTTQQVTTHREDTAELRRLFPLLSVIDNVRWVDDNNRCTSGGISAGIDMSLHLVEKLHSNSLAEQTARQMEFRWQKNTSDC